VEPIIVTFPDEPEIAPIPDELVDERPFGRRHVEENVQEDPASPSPEPEDAVDQAESPTDSSIDVTASDADGNGLSAENGAAGPQAEAAGPEETAPEQPKAAKKPRTRKKGVPREYKSETVSKLLGDFCHSKPNDEDLEDVNKGLCFFLQNWLEAYEGKEPPEFDPIHLDALAGSLDRAMSRQMDAILHAKEFQNLERTWLSLKFLVEHVNYNENIITEILNVKKEELLYDLIESPEIVRTVIYKIAYTSEYGQYGGQPYAALVGAYEFGSSQRDLQMLRSLSVLGSLAHTPFLGGVGKEFFNFEDWSELAGFSDFEFVMEEMRFAAYRSLRSQESSRYLCLALPGFLARAPYSPLVNPVDSWNYTETARNADSDYLWGCPQILLALKMADSFALYRWSVNITGIDGGGLVEGLPAIEYEAMGAAQRRISTQTMIGESLEYQMSQNGFIPFCDKENRGMAAFYSANTVLRPKIFGGGENTQESLNYRMSTMLPYMMIINRLAHYIKVIQRENIGHWKDSQTLERELNAWLNQYVTDMDSPSPSIRAKRPLRFARIEVREDPANPGWHFMKLSITPHFKFIGAAFTLNLAGRLDHVDFDG
jgi:type VI secretion system protein ImpC